MLCTAAWQHATEPAPRLAAAVEQAAEKPLKLARARHQSRLEELHARGYISLDQRIAGDRLAKDYAWSGEQLGNLVSRYAPWSPKGASPQIRDSVGQVDARARFEAALDGVGRWLAPILIHVCITDGSPRSGPG